MILFLNKKDIFDEKIRYFDLRDHFPAFTGSCCDSAEAKDFILNMFLTPVKNLRSVQNKFKLFVFVETEIIYG